MREVLIRNGTVNIRMLVNKFSREMLLKGTAFNIDDVIDDTGVQLIGVVPYDKTYSRPQHLAFRLAAVWLRGHLTV